MRKQVSLDVYVIMPNHFHGILFIDDEAGDSSHETPPPPKTSTELRTGELHSPSPSRKNFPGPPQTRRPGTSPDFHSPSQTVGSIVRGFKAATTRRINEQLNTESLPIWHRNYYEHVIRTEADLTRIREYIANYPARWAEDRFYIEDSLTQGG